MAWYIVSGVLNNTQAVPYPEGDAFIKTCVFSEWRRIKIPKNVEAIGREAFKGYRSINRIDIPQGVKRIEKGAFAQSGLTEITIPHSVEIIKGNVFEGCACLKKIIIPPDHPVFRIRNGLLMTHSGEVVLAHPLVQTVVVPQGAESIGNDAFARCGRLRRVKLSDTVKRIGIRAFSQCENLTDIDLPDGLKEIGDQAFWRCRNLADIDLPGGLEKIGDHAFEGCKSLRCIRLPEGLKTIGSYAFAGYRKSEWSIDWEWPGLERIDIPDSVVKIGRGAFRDCRLLRSVKAGSGLTGIEAETFQGCTSLQCIELSDRTVNAEAYAFEGCRSLTLIEANGHVFRQLDWSLRGQLQYVRCTSALGKVPPDIRIKAYITFARNERLYSSKCRTEHLRVIRRNSLKLAAHAAGEPALLNVMCREKLIAKEGVDEYVEKVLECENIEMTALILDYKNQVCPGCGDDEDDLTLDEWDDDDWLKEDMEE